MTAVASLKIFIADDDQYPDKQALNALVAKVAGTYLEKTWAWPRRFGCVAPNTFVLVDPRALRLDAEELQKLALDIQLRLFGASPAGEVALLMYEGDQVDVMRFAAAEPSVLKAILDGEPSDAFLGRICKITASGAVSLQPVDGATAGLPPASDLARGDTESLGSPNPLFEAPTERFQWWGTYFLPKERFLGSAINWPLMGGLDSFRCEDADAMSHDLAFLSAVRTTMVRSPAGHLFLPISYSAMVKPAMQAAYRTPIDGIEATFRPRLAANIYEVPREPSHSAISQIKAFLQPRFSLINLQVKDPGFNVGNLQPGVVQNVTLILTARVEAERLQAITRFHSDGESYRARTIWQGVAGIRTARELDLCRRLKIPFLSGPMISPLTNAPIGQAIWPAVDLPYRPWTSGS